MQPHQSLKSVWFLRMLLVHTDLTQTTKPRSEVDTSQNELAHNEFEKAGRIGLSF